MSNNLGGKTTKVGIVTGSKMEKTVSVLVERRVRHPLYKKIVKKKRYSWCMMNMRNANLVIR